MINNNNNNNNNNTVKWNLNIERVWFLLCTQRVPGSNLDPDTGYSE